MGFIIYKSSAGSGKTYTLVKEYLKIVLLDPNAVRHVLAITFTNKSANEMKQRILTYLKELSGFDEHTAEKDVKTLFSDLLKEMKMSRDDISSRSQNVLTYILHHYSDFNVSTIDSFTYRIMRAFAFDMQLPVDFDVELDQQRLISKAVDLLISKAGNDEKVTSLLFHFAEFKAAQEDNWQIEDDLADFAGNLIREEGYEKLTQLRQLSPEDFFSIRQSLMEIIMRFENYITGQARKCFELIAGAHLSPTAFYRYKTGLIKYLDRFAMGDFSQLEPNTHVLETVNEGKWYPLKTSSGDSRAILGIQAELLGIYSDITGYISRNKLDYRFATILITHIYQLALLNEIEKVIDEIRAQTKAVHISEFNKRIATLIRNEPVPFIYERVGEKFRHYFIDEFQDTSILQWQNLVPLIENSLASNHRNLIVGDAKQAIYRWRNGDVEQFINLSRLGEPPYRASAPENLKALASHIHCESLDTNYRSGKEIVEFNNLFFQTVATLLPDGLKDIYPGIQKPDKEKEGGLVSIELYDGQEEQMDFTSFNQKRVLEIIRELQEEKFDLRDIAILCRRNKEASDLAGFLVQQGVEVISSESLLVNNSPEVKFLMNVVAYLVMPALLQEISITRYLILAKRFPVTGLNDYIGGIHTAKPFDPKRLKGFLQHNGIGFDPARLVRLPVVELMEEMIRMFGLNHGSDPFIQFFLDAVLEFSARNGNDLSAFMEWWEEKKETWSVIVPEGMNAVQIMTIHKAKGLQFKAVIYPYASEKFRMTKKFVWVDIRHPAIPQLSSALLKNTKTLEDSVFSDVYQSESEKTMLDLLNLLYVVMTRPTHRLHILTEKVPNSENKFASIATLFHHFLQQRGLLADNQLKYEFGVRKAQERSDKKSKQEAEAVTLETMISISWRKRALLNLRATEKWDIAQTSQRVKWGNLVHTIMSGIRTENDLDRVLDDLHGKGTITGNERSELRALIGGFLSRPDLRRFFDPGNDVRNETGIIHPSGTSYRPDRVILSGKDAVVLDYKTGIPSESHHQQVRKYGDLLREMGYEKIETYLLYLNDDVQLVKIGYV